MPGPGEDEALPLDLTQLLPQRHGVGQCLTGMPTRRFEVDHRLLAVLGETVDNRILAGDRPIAPSREGTDTQRIGVAAHLHLGADF